MPGSGSYADGTPRVPLVRESVISKEIGLRGQENVNAAISTLIGHAVLSAKDTYTFGLKGTSGQLLCIDWGDSGKDDVALTGALQTFAYTYGNVDSFWIRIFGKPALYLTELHLSESMASLAIEARDLNELVALELLDLSGIGSLTGTFDDMDALTSLAELNIGNLTLPDSGMDVADLDVFTALEVLKANDSDLAGTMVQLNSYTSLTGMHLKSTSVTGDLDEIAALTALEEINIADTAITGSLSDISSLALTLLNINDTAIDGAISGLNTVTTLLQLLMANSSVTGSLADITGLTALTHLNGEGTAINGAISNLAASLVSVNLKDSSVTGDLVSLASLVDAEYVNLDGTSVSAFTDTTPAFLTGGSSAESSVPAWSGVQDGSFAITIDGVAYNVDGIDFSGDADMDDVAATIQAAIRAATSSTETCVWDTDHFVITTVAGDDNSITVLSTSGGTVGTDISGAGASDWMDADSGNGVVTSFLTGGSNAEDDYTVWAAVNDASFRITLGGTGYNVDAIDFSGDTDMADVAATIQTALRAATSGTETVVWSVDHFVITADAGDSIAVLETSTGTVGTDISGAGASDWMDCDTGNGVVSAYLTGDTGAQSSAASWGGVVDGSFRISIDGTAYNVDGISFEGDADMDDVAATIQAAIRALTGSEETVEWDTDHFVITTVNTDDSAITVTDTSTGTVGTDISGAGASDWMDSDTGNGTVTARTGDHFPPWDGIELDLQNLTITNGGTEVDAFLASLLEDGAVNGTLDMTGTTARTAASDAAVAGLGLAGWTLTLPTPV